MSNLYNKLMSKDMPAAAPALTARQMVQSPMGLRSAMKRYADGGDVTVAPPMATSAVPDYSRAYGALGGAEGVNALRNQLLGMGIGEDVIGSALSRYYAPEKPQTMMPPEPIRPPEATRPPPPPPPEKPRYEEPRYEEPRPDVRPVMPKIYPQDYNGPRTTDTSQPQQVGTRTSYRQEADGTLTEIGYDGQPISGYTPAQMAMHKDVTGVNPPRYEYVWNGEGYDKEPVSGITTDTGTFIPGYQGVGTPEFFAHYANNPTTMAELRQAYGFTGDQPDFQQPQNGYNQMENVAPQIFFNPADIPTNGFNEPEVNYQMPDPQQTQSEPTITPPTAPVDPRLSLLKKALSGQGVGSLMDSQKLAQLLRSLGYGK